MNTEIQAINWTHQPGINWTCCNYIYPWFTIPVDRRRMIYPSSHSRFILEESCTVNFSMNLMSRLLFRFESEFFHHFEKKPTWIYLFNRHYYLYVINERVMLMLTARIEPQTLCLLSTTPTKSRPAYMIFFKCIM